jgi:hypothetical protein
MAISVRPSCRRLAGIPGTVNKAQADFYAINHRSRDSKDGSMFGRQAHTVKKLLLYRTKPEQWVPAGNRTSRTLVRHSWTAFVMVNTSSVKELPSYIFKENSPGDGVIRRSTMIGLWGDKRQVVDCWIRTSLLQSGSFTAGTIAKRTSTYSSTHLITKRQASEEP